MKPSDVENALIKFITDADLGYPVALDNEDYTGPRPFFDVEVRPADRTTQHLGGDVIEEYGIVQVQAVTARGIGRSVGQQMQDAIVDLFSFGTVIQFLTGSIEIDAPARPDDPFSKDQDYIRPTLISYAAYSN